MNNYFVYVYYDGTIPFYVGMGAGKRHLDHIKYAQRAVKAGLPRNKLSHKLNKIIKLMDQDIMPTISIEHCNLTCEEAKTIEKQVIEKYGRADLGLGTLSNLTNGGDGVHGRTTMIGPDGECISILKEDKTEYEALGFVHFNKGRKHSDEVNQRKAAYWKGGTRPEHGAKVKAAAAKGAYKERASRGAHSATTLEKMRAPKKKREGYLNKKWYHSKLLSCEACQNTIPDWEDVSIGRLPKSTT
jgi:hypothetical protein